MKLTLDKVTKSYGSNLALNAFTADLEPGIYALLGPNGSGKSTLMNIITDNLKADSGSITYTSNDGVTEDVLKMGVRFREKLGFMPQYPGLYPNFSVERFLWYMAALKGMTKADALEQIPAILKAVELDDVPRRKIGALSGGMKQRLALAQAVLGDPEILILDEPTAGLDPKQRISIRNYISRIAFNKIVLIATHVVSDVEFIARDVIMLKKGVIVDNAPPAELLRKIDGGVWLVPCAEEDVQRLQNEYRVTNISRDETTGDVLLRVLCEEKPQDNARAVAPTLEDYYLRVFGEDAAHSDG
ncbi:MAG: ATP-binding cassette domain-containing protein [Oscillospiraceae bacterium]|nr:ATP-binding cassette domain-containing protein [Oscillospiraceae bacterium]